VTGKCDYCSHENGTHYPTCPLRPGVEHPAPPRQEAFAKIETPPLLMFDEGQFWLEVFIENRLYRAPMGDGRYHAQRVFELIVGPSIAPRVADAADPAIRRQVPGRPPTQRQVADASSCWPTNPAVGKTGAAIMAADYVLARTILVVTTASGRSCGGRLRGVVELRPPRAGR
jgi:hypothetical protein